MATDVRDVKVLWRTLPPGRNCKSGASTTLNTVYTLDYRKRMDPGQNDAW
jgi:hypothetical protein